MLPLNVFFFFNDTATTEIYTLSLHDALPIYHFTVRSFITNLQDSAKAKAERQIDLKGIAFDGGKGIKEVAISRSEEHTSELQSRQYLVCRLLLEKKKNNRSLITYVRFCTVNT